MLLPIFGFFTNGVFGLFTIWLPEMFPSALRGSGSGFAFSMGRVLGAAGPSLIGALAATTGSYPLAISLLSLIYIVGLPFISLAPETAINLSRGNAEPLVERRYHGWSVRPCPPDAPQHHRRAVGIKSQFEFLAALFGRAAGDIGNLLRRKASDQPALSCRSFDQRYGQAIDLGSIFGFELHLVDR